MEHQAAYAYKAPEIPNKYDVIPIHNSDRGNFKRCRQYWNWSSPARNNLMLRAEVYGINTDLWFGTGIHWALEQYYNPGLRHDPVESWKTWFDIQWRGGIVTEEWLPLVYDLRPQPIPPDLAGLSVSERTFNVETGEFSDTPVTMLWKVRGLSDIIPDPDHDKFDELFTLGVEMTTFYKSYAERNDDFDVIMVEHIFSIPVWDYENDRILTRRDVREESPNYGKELEVHARGRMDAITQRRNSSKLGIIDHKTASVIGEDYFVKLETDEQATSYLYAAQVEANYYDLPHKGKPFEEITFNVMRKAYPKQPTPLKNGMFSVDRTNESTTYEILQEWIRRNMPGVPLNEKQQGYVDYLKEVGDEQFIIRHPERRSQAELAYAGEQLYLESMDMLGEPRIYRNMRNDWLCMNCQFRVPCLSKSSGGDFHQILANDYTVSRDR